MFARLVAIALGIVLLFASVMKGLALHDRTLSPGGIPSEWWLSMVVAGFELCLGAWLVSGVFPLTARRLALLCFAVFGVVALVKALQGEASCGCLGQVDVSPVYTVVFDAVVVAVLAGVRPRKVEDSRRWEGGVVLVGTVALAVGLGLTVYTRATAVAQGLVVRGEAVHEFGDVEQDAELTHVFRLENTGPLPVEVVSTTSSCGCTTVQGVVGQIVGPGQSLDIPLTLHTKDSEEHLVGAVTLFCRVAGSSSPASMFRKLQVAGKVRPDYWVRPMVIDFGVVDHDRPVRRIIRIRPHLMPDAAVAQVEVAHPALAARLSAERSPEGDQEVEVTFSGKHMIGDGPVDARLTILTNSPRKKSTEALVRVYYRAPVTIEPRAVVLGSDDRGTVAREIMVTALHPIQIVDLRAPDWATDVVVTQVNVMRWQIRLTLPETIDGTARNGSLLFKVRPQDTTVAKGARDVAIPVHRLPGSPSRGAE